MIPQYLQRPEHEMDEKVVGTLEPIIEKDKVIKWKLTAVPGVLQTIKRIFPGTEGRRGCCFFYNNKRICADLNWVMLRYNIEIADPERWESSYQEAVTHMERIRQFSHKPDKIVPPATFKGELKEFQKEGLAYLVNAERTLLADEMGLGKTAQALAFLAEKNAYPAIIIVPPHLIKNWENEIDKFIKLPEIQGEQLSIFGDSTNYKKVHVIKGLKPYELPNANIYIMHYSLLRGWLHIFEEPLFKAVIFDEIQELRHTKTQKYSAASLLAQNTPYCIGLSGTPIYNRGGEIWSVMNIIEYHCLGDWESFTREWCSGYGTDIVLSPDILGDYLKDEGLMLRRRKQEVLTELPPKRRVVQTIDFDSGQYSNLIQSAIEKAKQIESIKDVMERGRLTRIIVNDSRQAIGIAKAPYVASFVKMLLEAGESLLLFAYHHAVFDIYMEELQSFGPVRITGKESIVQKQDAVNKFMNGETNVCMISLRAAAGLNLQRATVVVFGELDWSPAIHSQAEDRAHRIGQTDSVLSYYLVAEEGTDETIQEFLGLKISQFNGLMGDGGESEEDKVIAQTVASEHMKKIVNKLKNK